jgi:hypothetical protein
MEPLMKQSDLNSEKNTGRRSFIWKMGAAMTAGVLASSVPTAAKDKSVGELSERLAILEAEKCIIGLYHTYESLLNDGNYDKIPELFVTDGEAVYNGGVFKGRDTGVTRLYNNQFRSGLTGKKMDATLDSKEGHSIELSEDHLSATSSFPFAIQAGAPMISDSVLVSMARLHGGGINKWRENGICELSLTRKSREDVWMIKRLEYRTELKSASVPAFTEVFPADPAGPDALEDGIK